MHTKILVPYFIISDKQLCPFGGGGAGSPSNTMWPGPRPTSLPGGILIHPAVWPQQTWAKNWGGIAPLGEGELGPHLTQCGLGQGLSPYQVVFWSIQTTIDMGRKLDGCYAPFVGEGGELGPHVTQCGLGWGLPPYQMASYTDADNACTHKFWNCGAAVPLSIGEAESPSNTMWPGPRPTCMPSFILIHPVIWPQYTNVTNRTG